MKKNILLFLVCLIPTGLLAQVSQSCNELNEKAEKSFSAHQLATAVTLAEKAIKVCDLEKGKTARPYMVLAATASRRGDYKSVIQWSESGLQKEPGLSLAHMNICSAHIELKNFDKAIKACETGLAKSSEWDAKLHFNLGLAYFKKAVDQQKWNETLLSEKHFLTSQKQDAAIAQNYYFLGVMEEHVKYNPAQSLEYYKKGCDRNDLESCKNLKSLQSKASQSPLPSSPAKNGHVVSAGASQEPHAPQTEEALWNKLKSSYVKKGMTEAAATQAVQQVKRSMASVPANVRLQSLQKMTNF